MTTVAVSQTPVRADAHVIPNSLERLHIHMVGVGGCGMSALAGLLLRRGTRVSGSDMRPSAELARLVECGARITTEQRAEAVPEDADLVVASAAVPADHPELLQARRRGIHVVKYAELLGAVMSHYDGIGISGTHGKSTTTAWLAFVLRRAGLDPSFVVGATVGQLGGGSGVGDGPHFIAEACEFDRSFLNLRPRRAAILNIEEDHLDCYKDLDAIRAAFAAFAGGVAADGLVVLNGEDERCQAIAGGIAAEVQTFGSAEGRTWRATGITLADGYYSFNVEHAGTTLGRVRPLLAGRHNVDNALAVIALAHHCGVAWADLQAGLCEFNGAHRRLELRGAAAGRQVLDDYAHHPTEIRATLRAARERFNPRRLWCVFQPHQHSRTRFLLADFAGSFAHADRVVVPDIYFVRDSQRERELVCAEDLVKEIRLRGGNATYAGDFGSIVELLACETEPGDVILTMGAGNIWKVADELVQRLGGHVPD
jgi:UDP-N-acetylmuramate--alanine ligase